MNQDKGLALRRAAPTWRRKPTIKGDNQKETNPPLNTASRPMFEVSVANVVPNTNYSESMFDRRSVKQGNSWRKQYPAELLPAFRTEDVPCKRLP